MGFNERGKKGVHKGRTVRSSSRKNGRQEGILQVKGFSDDKIEAVPSAKEEFVSGVLYSLGKRRRWIAAAEMRSAQSDQTVVVVERIDRPTSKPSQSQRADCLSASKGCGKLARSNKRLGARVNDLLKKVKADPSDVTCEVSYPLPNFSWAGESSCLPKQIKKKKASYSRRKIDVQSYDWNIDHEEDIVEVDEVSEQGCASLNFDIGAYIEEMIENPVDVVCKPGGKQKATRTNRKIKGGKPNQKCSNRSHIIADDESVEKWMVSKKERDSKALVTTPSAPTREPTKPWLSNLVTINKKEMDPKNLKQQFQENYREAPSLPRTFEIKVTQVPSGYEENLSCSLIVKFQSVVSSESSFDKVCVNLVAVAQNNLDIAEDLQIAFSYVIQDFFPDFHTSSVKDLVRSGIDTLAEVLSSVESAKAQYSKLRRTKFSTSLLGTLHGWKAKAFVIDEAEKEAKKDLTNKALAMASEVAWDRKDGFNGQKGTAVSCGICFADLKQNGFEELQCTAMMDCCHWFCDECWQMHIHAQSIEGKAPITCPGYQCTTVIDPITVMALIPSWYGKHTRRIVGRELDNSPVWRWCPSDRCSLAVKAVPRFSPTDQKFQPGPIPVVCGCGNVWCFSCQHRAHWPASCQQAEHFRKVHRRFFQPDKDLITSVRVKQCPRCMYPIEKHMGCNNMTCIRCGTNFCWGCLHLYKHCVCRWQRFPSPQPTGYIRVELPLDLDITPEEDPFVYIALKSLRATNRKLLTKHFRRLEWLEGSLRKSQVNVKDLSVPTGGNSSTKAEDLVHFLAANEVPNQLKAVYNVKFQAQLVLEGTAIFIGCYRKKTKPENLDRNLLRLQFIVDRLEEILSKYSTLTKKGNLEKLSSFATEAIKTISAIGRKIRANTKQNL